MKSSPDISQNKSLLWLMAIACGLSTGANYYCQPLIHSIQQYFDVPESQVALTVTFAQISYALGLLLIVPAGDIVNKTKFIPLLMSFTAIGLLICAFAINLPMLWLGTVITGLFSVAAQVLIPLSVMATRPEKTGEVIGFLMSGLLVGLLLSTSLSGLLSNLFHWKLIYSLSGALMLLLAFLLKSRLPYVMAYKMGYFQVFRSMGQLLRQERRLILRSVVGGCAFAAMSILFSTIALLLTSEPFQLADVFVGVITLAGVFGALSTQYAGKLADRGLTGILTTLGCVIMAISWYFLYIGGHILVSYIAGYGLIALGLAMIHSSNQNIIFRIRPDARSRINAIYMTLYFTGGACGSILGVYAWYHGGWNMACLVGLGLVLGAAAFSLLDYFYAARLQKS
ncbi:MFS transporter [Acinetobacter sp. WZC-1]|uniref:MFS transporter n=1 Tax=Acinetobacter sp. WZC-1 TaxID=3459034 RepID=UPI00403E127F